MVLQYLSVDVVSWDLFNGCKIQRPAQRFIQSFRGSVAGPATSAAPYTKDPTASSSRICHFDETN